MIRFRVELDCLKLTRGRCRALDSIETFGVLLSSPAYGSIPKPNLYVICHTPKPKSFIGRVAVSNPIYTNLGPTMGRRRNL
jgi:hypothetical protein